jgi:hypothetical protein
MSLPTKRSLERARVSNPGGAGGELLGETPATPSGILEAMPDEIRRKLPDEVVDELLAGARTEEEIVGPGGLPSQLTKRSFPKFGEVGGEGLCSRRRILGCDGDAGPQDRVEQRGASGA